MSADARDWGTLRASNLNAARAAMGASGGGEISVPVGGDVVFDEPLVIDADRVQFSGLGPCSWAGNGAGWTPGTRFVKNFSGGPLVIMRSPYGAGKARKEGLGLRDVLLDGNNVNDGHPVLQIDSCSMLDVSCSVTGAVGAGNSAVQIKCGVSETDLAGQTVIQNSKLDFFVRQVDTLGQRAAHCVSVLGSSNANLSCNEDDDEGLSVTAHHADGRALNMLAGDKNKVFLRSWRHGGTGAALWLGGARSACPLGATYNDFTVSVDAPIYAEGTNDAGVLAGVENIIRPDFGNNTPMPIAGTGSRWAIVGQCGDLSNHMLVKAVMADSRWAAALQRTLMNYETVRLYNGSQTHAIITDGANEWLVRIGASGDLDVIKLAGEGCLSLPYHGYVKLGGKRLAWGAPDSGGSGYRTLHIEN